MTKVQNPIIGRSRGSAGGMTFSKNFDKNVMRAKAFEVKNPKTTAQMTQRDFFKQVQDITSTVTDEQLRSLFGDMPKSMSRRNALSKQIAAAFSVNGNQKTVDFSKLQAIGNGKKVNSPIVPIVNGIVSDDTGIDPELLELPSNTEANLILVIFDSDNNKILLNNIDAKANASLEMQDMQSQLLGVSNGYFYVTCEENGIDVYDNGFGTFTIKTRADKSEGTIPQTDEPLPGNTITITDTAAGSTATLNFGNYQFNNLSPAIVWNDKEESTIIAGSNPAWTDNENGTYSTETEASVSNGQTVYLEIEQGGDVVDLIPFRIVVL